MEANISPNIMKVLKCIRAFGGRPLIVGGYVRDLVLGVPSNDVDIEVYGLPAFALKFILSRFGKVKEVGQKFGIFHMVLKTGESLDFSLPRRDNRVGVGHKGFKVTLSPWMSSKDAAARRNYTINSMALNPFTGEILDPFNGQADLRNRVLRHTSPAFSEDPLRLLIGVQLSGRYDLVVNPETSDVCYGIRWELHYLSIERIWAEWEKWAAKSIVPGRGLMFLWETGVTELYPELECLLDSPQDPIWHPEGNVFEHTCYVVDAMAKICAREGIVGEERLVLMFAALCHDMGKPSSYAVLADGRIHNYGHDEAGVSPAWCFLHCIGAPLVLLEKVPKLVRYHLDHLQRSSARSIRRLAVDLAPATLRELVYLIEADQSGRPPLPGGVPPEAARLLEVAIAENVTVKAQGEILMGRHLIDRGMQPGPAFKPILRSAYEAQLDGVFTDIDGAQVWLDNYLKSTNRD